MDFATLKSQIDAARRFEVETDGATFTLIAPTDHGWRNAFESHRDEAGRYLEARIMRALLDTALVGWSGVIARHFILEAGDEAIPFNPSTRAELLDARQDIADVLGMAIAERKREAREKREAAKKN